MEGLKLTQEVKTQFLKSVHFWFLTKSDNAKDAVKKRLWNLGLIHKFSH